VRFPNRLEHTEQCIQGIGAKFAFPDRAVIALVGDGAMLMNGVNELITIADYWKEWSDPRLIIMVLANRDLNQVTWEQRALAGDPKFETSQTVPQFGFARTTIIVAELTAGDATGVGYTYSDSVVAELINQRLKSFLGWPRSPRHREALA